MARLRGVTEDLIRVRLFFISYAPLWLMLACRAAPSGGWHDFDKRSSWLEFGIETESEPKIRHVYIIHQLCTSHSGSQCLNPKASQRSKRERESVIAPYLAIPAEMGVHRIRRTRPCGRDSTRKSVQRPLFPKFNWRI